MKDEIKEILDLKIDCDYKRLNIDEIVILKDYITNLQEDLEYSDYCNKKLREKIINLEYKINLLQGVDKE